MFGMNLNKTFQTIHSLPYNVPKIETQALSSEPIPQIDQLYSPTFPLEVVRQFVMGAIHEAVEINQVHNRDPIGGSNENLFL
jgi:ryanodine receptor 2